jgi:hypothetical protein
LRRRKEDLPESRAGYRADATQSSDENQLLPKCPWISDGLAIATAPAARPPKPAAPMVERGTVWTDTVKRGPMLRQGGNRVLCL